MILKRHLLDNEIPGSGKRSGYTEVSQFMFSRSTLEQKSNMLIVLIIESIKDAAASLTALRMVTYPCGNLKILDKSYSSSMIVLSGVLAVHV